MNTIYDGSYTLGSTSALTFEAGPGIQISEPSAGTVRIGNDETVLWSAPTTAGDISAQLSESPLNFKSTKFYMHDDGGTCWGVGEFLSESANGFNKIQCGFTTPWNTTGFRCIVAINMDSSLLNWYTDGYQWWGGGGSSITSGYMKIMKVVGINRISGGNA